MARDLVTKYDQLAGGFAEHSYANLHFYMHRRFTIATTWGISLQPRDSVLELGCGDGYLAQLFVQHGLQYCGVDIFIENGDHGRTEVRRVGIKSPVYGHGC